MSSKIIFDPTDFLKRLTSEPGVYQMLNDAQEVIYVGKAKNLKKRVSSYFNKKQMSSKTVKLVEQIASIDVTVTRTEKEALLLENTLIKTLSPKYNVLMRDDKSYPYLKIEDTHPFPRFYRIRSKIKPDSKAYFGPYPHLAAVKEALNWVQKLFKLRSCSDMEFQRRSRPCLQYQLKRCLGPCVGLVSKEAYDESVKHAALFLSGKSDKIITMLETQMLQAAHELAFEQAAKLRDQMTQLRHIQEQQNVVLQEGDVDIILPKLFGERAIIQWASVRKGQVLSTQSFYLKVPYDAEDAAFEALFKQFIIAFYQGGRHAIPKKILVCAKRYDEMNILEDLLSEWAGDVCHIECQLQPRGKKAQWFDFVRHNLEHALTQETYAASLFEYRYGALEQLLQIPIQRMVCFDVSHIQGTHTVVSCVVFNRQGPEKSAYRRFNIKEGGGDDYAALSEAVMRYFSHDLEVYPDLILIDGGKGQVRVAQEALKTIGYHRPFQLLGISKGDHRRAAYDQILWDTGEKTAWSTHSPGVQLLQSLRDEAHRFALKSHRKQRGDAVFSSSLTELPGIGPKRKQALFARFGGLKGLKNASLEEILKVPGMSLTLARRVYEYCHL